MPSGVGGQFDQGRGDELRIVPFHKDFSPSGEQLELRKLGHEL